MNVERTMSGPWEYLFASKNWDDLTGKYLFFSEDRARLTVIAEREIEKGPHIVAKVPREGEQKGDDYVLCLYHEDDSREDELRATYGDLDGIQFRGWKSNEETMRDAAPTCKECGEEAEWSESPPNTRLKPGYICRNCKRRVEG